MNNPIYIRVLQHDKNDQIRIGEAYLKGHIIKSLDSYFGNTNDDRIIDDISQEGYVSKTGEDYPVLMINDVADYNSMLEFVVLRQTYDVLNLSFLGRIKG